MDEYKNSELFNLYNTYEAEGKWMEIYQQINQKSSFFNYPNEHTHNLALKVENRSKNRYNNIIPYDHAIVPILYGNKNGYINASFVSLKGHPEKRYILCQGPLSSTVEDFWQMVWEIRPTLILMLNKFTEKGVIKCAKYLPSTENRLNYERFSVICTEEQHSPTYIERNITLIPKDMKDSRFVVKHINYRVWPDFGVPTAIDNFLLLVHKLQSNNFLSDPQHPAIIHCSAGAGRSGAFVVIDLILSTNSMNGINLSDIICNLRTCRMGLIQTPQQFKFCFQSILRASELIFSLKSDMRHKWHESLIDNDLDQFCTENFDGLHWMQNSWSNSSNSTNEHSEISSESSDNEERSNIQLNTPETFLRNRIENHSQENLNNQKPTSDSLYTESEMQIKRLANQEAKSRRLKRQNKNSEHIKRLKEHLQNVSGNRWRLPDWIRRPLSRFYVSSGYFQNLKQAVYWTVFGLLVVGMAAYISVSIKDRR